MFAWSSNSCAPEALLDGMVPMEVLTVRQSKVYESRRAVKIPNHAEGLGRPLPSRKHFQAFKLVVYEGYTETNKRKQQYMLHGRTSAAHIH